MLNNTLASASGSGGAGGIILVYYWTIYFFYLKMSQTNFVSLNNTSNLTGYVVFLNAGNNEQSLNFQLMPTLGN